VSAGPRIAFSTLAFPDASLATALSLDPTQGYGGVQLRLIDGELIDPSMPARTDWLEAAARALEANVPAAARLGVAIGVWRLALLGEGEVRVQEMLGLLTGGGYQRWISVECEKPCTKEIEGPEVALPQPLRLLESWLRDPQEAV
jgi:hypothetical protein